MKVDIFNLQFAFINLYVHINIYCTYVYKLVCFKYLNILLVASA